MSWFITSTVHCSLCQTTLQNIQLKSAERPCQVKFSWWFAFLGSTVFTPQTFISKFHATYSWKLQRTKQWQCGSNFKLNTYLLYHGNQTPVSCLEIGVFAVPWLDNSSKHVLNSIRNNTERPFRIIPELPCQCKSIMAQRHRYDQHWLR